MKSVCMKKYVLLACGILLALLEIFGCSWLPRVPLKPFPAPLPDKAELSIHYNPSGEFFIADQNGEAILPKPICFEDLIQNTDLTERGWLKVLGSYTVYRIGDDDGKVWLCDKDFNCFESRMEVNHNNAVFSINYDGESIFLANAKGLRIGTADLKALGSLIQESRLGKKFKIKTIDTTVIYAIRGSTKIVKCTPNHICFCICLNSNGTKSPCVNGRCP